MSQDLDGNDKTTVIASPMVLCKKEFFKKYNGYNISEANVASYEKRLCPNIEEKAFQDLWKLKNGFSNSTERVSFAIQAIKCTGTYCANIDDIKTLHRGLMYTMRVVEDKVQFGKNDS